MKLRVFAVVVAGMLLVAASQAQTFTGKLMGFQESPAVVSAGTGTVRITIDGDRINYELTFSGLEGGAVGAAHIHVGQRNVSGGVSVFFCNTPPAVNPPPQPTHNGGAEPVPHCDAAQPFTGFWTAADVVGPKAQGVDPADPNRLARLIQAIKAGRSYANVHTVRSPTGEIRGQLVRLRDDDDDSN